ncbi:MAG: radical SAM family heme chaperone HemW [Bacilli bacterium]|nr:radical SAM family heme chaperone HemW [Bacilli bacterium]
MSIYLHIPFCSHICTYCDFPKVLKNKTWIKQYLKSLEKEIKQNYKGEIVDTIYIGGGTPSALDLEDLKTLFDIIKLFKIKENTEITLEANSEDLTENKLKFLKDKINRLSIGIETFNKKILKTLNRKINIKNIKNAFNYFNNINLDLMYGFKNQSLNDLEEDLEKIINLNPTHISTYSLIIEPNTKLYIENYQNIEEDKDRKMYEMIIKKLRHNNYIQYEISNFSKKGYESKHNLVYWNNKKYYGFGLGAGGYIENTRYENTRSLNNYLKGNYKLNEHKLSKSEEIQNELILGFRKIKGINKNTFKKKYKMNLKDIKEINKLLEKKLLIEDKNNIYINSKYIYISNEILINFIDYVYPKESI